MTGGRKKTMPSRGAKVLLVERSGPELERLSELLRDAGYKVMALSRPEALVPLTNVFRPDVAVLGLDSDSLDCTRLGRRIARRTRGTVPVIYVGSGKQTDPDTRRYCLQEGRGAAFLEREHALWQLPIQISSLVDLRFAVTDAERTAVAARPPSMHDEVTGLYNRRFLLELVAAEARRGERYGGCFSVVIAELDDFTSFHDRLGDEVCDRLMVYCATLLKQVLREADVLARVGKYHFGLLLPGMPAEAMPGLIDRLARRFQLARFPIDGQSLQASMTLGAATFPDVVGPADQIFARAIQELDRAREVRREGPPRAAV